MMIKYPIYKQDNIYSCGVYCIKMILKYYHIDEETKNIKQKSRVTANGVSVYGIISCLKDYHIEAKGYQCDFNTLINEAKTPCIIHLKIDDLLHYVVLYKITKKYCLIGDPGKGLVKMTYEELSSLYTNVVIMIEHVGRYLGNNSELTLMKFTSKYFKDEYKLIYNMIIKTIIISILSVISSYYYQWIIDGLKDSKYYLIVLISLGFILVFVIKTLLTYYRNIVTLNLKKKLDNRYVINTIKNMVYLDLGYFNINQEGIVLAKSNNLFQLSDYLIKLTMTICIDSMLIIVVLSTIMLVNFKVFLIVVVFCMLMLVLLIRTTKIINVENKKIIDKQETTNQALVEYHNNIYNTHQFNLKRFAKVKINYLYDEYIESNYDKDIKVNRLNNILELLIQTMIIMVIVGSIYLYQNKELTIGLVIMIYMLLSYVIEPIINISSILVLHDEIEIIFERYKEMVPTRYIKKKKIKHIREIKLDHITFSYGYTRPILDHLDLIIDHSINLIGKTGSGKSTILKLITGQNKVIKGRILVNGNDLEDIDLSSLYKRIIYLDKSPSFYQESLRFNLLLQSNDEDKMMWFLNYFQLDQLIDNLDQRLDYNGGFLSSGQQQLVMLIRSLLKDIDILILDEAYSNVDSQRVKLLQDYLNTKRKNLIIINVSHQINIMNNNYDCVIIDSGQIIK